jgi:hypothetical protein
MTGKIHVPNPEAGAFQQRIQSPQNFMRDMLNDEKFFHVSIIVAFRPDGSPERFLLGLAALLGKQAELGAP